jgi:hypothetical protein
MVARTLRDEVQPIAPAPQGDGLTGAVYLDQQAARLRNMERETSHKK